VKGLSPATARAYMEAWARAIVDHPDLSEDVERCYAATHVEDARATALRRHAEELWQAIPPPKVCDHLPAAWTDPTLYLVRLQDTLAPSASVEHARAFVDAHLAYRVYASAFPNVVRSWLRHRYSGLWAEAPFIADYYLDHALGVAISHGDMGAAFNPFVLPVSNTGHVGVSIFDDARTMKAPWESPLPAVWSSYVTETVTDTHHWKQATDYVPRHPVLALHLNPGATKKEAMHALSREWSRVEPYIEKQLGTGPRGPKDDYRIDVELYSTWRQWERGGRTRREFIKAYNGPTPDRWRLQSWGDSYDISERGLTKRLQKACQWLDPRVDADTPASLTAHLALVFGT